LFLDRLQQAQAQVKRDRKHNALLILDLDNFKDINDTHGHRMGDEIQRMAATRLAHCSRGTDTVAHLGGDVFAIICTELGHGNLVQSMAQRLIEAMTKPFMTDDETIRATASIGIALFPGDADQLIKFADMALHQAMASGHNRYHFFFPAMDEAVRGRKRLEDDLRRAIDDETFTLLYQPQLRLGDGQVYGAEALVRWNHPDRGLVSPADFIPLAESTGLIHELGHWVLRTACVQGRAWADTGHGDLRIA
jgi:diguanylate cyclase (GGDEF)-like protein